jgi:predicted nucleic acid-binding protein
MPAIADGETKRRDADCHNWLHANGVQILPVTGSILNHALQIKRALGITLDRDYRDGVSENDLIIIGTCMAHAIELITNESKQNQLPQNRARYKIPAVCTLTTVNVQYLNFRDLLVRSGQVF